MTGLSLFWLLTACAALALTMWTLPVALRLRTQPLFSPVKDWVSVHPLARGCLVDPHTHDAGQPSGFCLAVRPSRKKSFLWVLASVTPLVNLTVLALMALVVLGMLALIAWAYWEGSFIVEEMAP